MKDVFKKKVNGLDDKQSLTEMNLRLKEACSLELADVCRTVIQRHQT